MPEVISPLGSPYGYNLVYGRPELHDLTKRPLPEDVPLKPGESCILILPEQELAGWESSKSHGKAFDPKKVRLIFAGLNFGDGTGFSTTEGKPYPRKASSCIPQRKANELGTITMADPGISNYLSLQLSSSSLPVNFLPANFLPAGNSISGKTPPQSGLCCPGTPCYNMKDSTYSCLCGTGFITESSSNCSEPGYECSEQLDSVRSCEIGGLLITARKHLLQAVRLRLPGAAAPRLTGRPAILITGDGIGIIANVRILLLLRPS
jgi:hypothetical protein